MAPVFTSIGVVTIRLASKPTVPTTRFCPDIRGKVSSLSPSNWSGAHCEKSCKSVWGCSDDVWCLSGGRSCGVGAFVSFVTLGLGKSMQMVHSLLFDVRYVSESSFSTILVRFESEV